MSFEQLLGRISNGSLRVVAEHWNEARAARRMPGWSDIRPAAIVRSLPIIWSWKYDRASDQFVGRLAGEEIVHAFGENLRGRTAEEFFRDRGGETIIARHRRVVTEPCFFHGAGAVFAHAKRIVRGERIILPLAEDGENGDGVIGATIYNVKDDAGNGPMREGNLAVEEQGEFIAL